MPYGYNPQPLTEQEHHAFCNPLAPTTPLCYSDVITLTDADDLADYLPAPDPHPIAAPVEAANALS